MPGGGRPRNRTVTTFGITVDVCAEPELSTSQFLVSLRRPPVRDRGELVGTDGIWQVDVIDSSRLLCEFADATGYARAHLIALIVVTSRRPHGTEPLGATQSTGCPVTAAM